MTESVVFTTKISQLDGSDVPGGSLPAILFAHFWKDELGGRVVLHDPFYSSASEVRHRLDAVTDHMPVLGPLDRVVSQVFYSGRATVGRLDLNIEVPKSSATSLSFRKKELRLNAPWAPIEIAHEKSLNALRALDTPYVYYFDLLARQKYQPNLQLRSPVGVAENFLQSRNVYGLQVRLGHWKQVDNKLSPDGYRKFLRDIVKKISAEDPRHLILFYGDWGSDKELQNDLKRACQYIDVNAEYPTMLERAWALGQVNVSIGSVNGFALFSNYLSLSSNRLRAYYIVNDVERLDQTLHVRRILSEGISEERIGRNAHFFSRFQFFPKDSILGRSGHVLPDCVTGAEPFGTSNPLGVVFYGAALIRNHFFNEVWDDFFIRLMAERFQQSFPLVRVFLHDGQRLRTLRDDLPVDTDEKFLLNCQHVMTHYSIQKYCAEGSDERMGVGSLDFEHPFQSTEWGQRLRNALNPSNYLYEKLLQFMRREAIRNTFTDRDVMASNRILLVSAGAETGRYTAPYQRKEIRSHWAELSAKLRTRSPGAIVRAAGRRLARQLPEPARKRILQDAGRPKYSADVNSGILESAGDHLIDEGAGIVLRRSGRTIAVDRDPRSLAQVIGQYDKIVCRPCSLSLAVRTVDSRNRSVLFCPSGFGVPVSRQPNLFVADPVLNYEDFWDLHFVGQDELLLHLGVGAHILASGALHQDVIPSEGNE